MSIFTTHPDILTLNFHTGFQLQKVALDIFCFEFWLDIQDFIFGLGMSIFLIHHEISILNFHTDLQTRDLTFIFISSFVFCLDFWLKIQDFIFGLGMYMPIFPIHQDISTINFHTDFQSGKFNLDLFLFDFWIDYQIFIFGLGVSIFLIHHAISTLSFQTDLQTEDLTTLGFQGREEYKGKTLYVPFCNHTL